MFDDHLGFAIVLLFMALIHQIKATPMPGTPNRRLQLKTPYTLGFDCNLLNQIAAFNLLYSQQTSQQKLDPIQF